MIFNATSAGLAAAEDDALEAYNAPAISNVSLDFFSVEIALHALVGVRQLYLTQEVIAEGAEKLVGWEKVFAADLPEKNACTKDGTWGDGMGVGCVYQLLPEKSRMDFDAARERFPKKGLQNGFLFFLER